MPLCPIPYCGSSSPLTQSPPPDTAAGPRALPMETLRIVPSERARRPPKRFFKNQIPDSILADPALNDALALLPSNYSFEVHKSVWRIVSAGAKRVALQFPEGLLMYSLILSDIFTRFAGVDQCFVLGDVTYGACCVDDYSAIALKVEFLIHYGHSCLVPIDYTKIPTLYVFVEIKFDVRHLVDTIKQNFAGKTIALAGTIQFSTAIRAVKVELDGSGVEVIVPQAKPLSAGEILGCTSPKMPKGAADAVVFVADGRFHLEAFMIANPEIRAFRYDPYLKAMFLEEYDHVGMKDARRNAIVKAKEAKTWGIVLGTLGRQGNPRILDRLQKKMTERGLPWSVILMSELSPQKIALFGDSIDAWVQIACPRLSIDWGEAFGKPLLTPFEAEIALGLIQGWWEKGLVGKNAAKSASCGTQNGDSGSKCCSGKANGSSCSAKASNEYPMDYYAQDGGEWNCAYSKKSSTRKVHGPAS